MFVARAGQRSREFPRSGEGEFVPFRATETAPPEASRLLDATSDQRVGRSGERAGGTGEGGGAGADARGRRTR